MRIDLHCHTKFSGDNHFEPEALLAEAAAKGLDGVCITEHFSVDASLKVLEVDRPEGLVVLRGAEISTEIGHMLVFGPADGKWNRWGNEGELVDHEKAVRAVKASGGVCIPSHPYRGIVSMGDSAFDSDLFDAVETLNGANPDRMNDKAVKAARKHGMNGIGGSDAHSPGEVGRAYTIFQRWIYTVEELVVEIKSGRFRPERMKG